MNPEAVAEEEIVMVPGVLVESTVVPPLPTIDPTTYEDPLPTNIFPVVGVAVTPVPPLAIGTVPVREIFVNPTEERVTPKGELAVTIPTVAYQIVVEAAVKVIVLFVGTETKPNPSMVPAKG